jgi:peptide/nickel transport system substrate-binding protein
MYRTLTRSALAVLTASLAVGLAACGGSSSTSSSSSSTSSSSDSSTSDKYNAAVPVSGQSKGGSIKFLSAESFQHLDPGTAYFQLDYMIDFAVHRSLYYYKPDEPTTPIPDLAEGDPQVAADGKTVTVKLKHGIKYGTNDTSSPVNGQEVTAQDVKYAFERGYNPHVANGYLGVYFPLVGADKAKGGPVSGITTPDKYTLVLKLTKDLGATTAKALVMPITMPVPKSYAQQLDAKNPSGYDADPTKQAFSGPYMIKEYSPGKSLTLVRNPNWDGSNDTRPAYLDEIKWTMGNDPNVAGRQIFNGKGLANGDTQAAPIVKQFATKKPKQISFTSQGNRWVSLNYTKKPFSDINVRKAAAAILDRTAMQRVRGGAAVGDVANHFLSPGLPGFEEAGGLEGTGVDFLAKPGGDPAVAAEYMKKAGYASGKADGQQILMIGDNSSPAKEDALIVANSLEKLGFKVKAQLVEHSVFYSKFCQQKAQLVKIDVCANFGWLADFADPYAMVYANFSGKAIVPVNGNNPSLFNDPQINAEMDKGATIADETERAKAWGDIDRQLTEKVAAIPWFWDKTANVAADDVQGVIAKWNAAWDLSYMSLKR